MQPKEFEDLTRKAIREIPKTWQKFGQPYLPNITQREILVLNLMAVATGIIAGYGAIAFRYLIGFFQNTLMHGQLGYQLTSPLAHIHEAYIIIIPPIGLLITAYLVRWTAPEAKGHGVPEVIEAVMAHAGKIRPRIVGIKALASAITIACGGSVGREGPIVQIGSAAGSSLGQFFQLHPKLLKTLVGCGAGGAIAATFNTPIAGVIFAIELIILELKTKSFIPLVITSVFATVVSRVYLGNETAFEVPQYTFVDPQELIFYLGLGLLSGIVGVLVIRAVYGMEDFFENLRIPFFFKPLLGGLALGLIAYKYPEILGVGYETISEVLHQQSSFQLMLSLVFLKIAALALTLAAGGSGGVFAPSLFIGAMLGGAYGSVVNDLFPEITAGHGAYALVGMAALFSATGRASFTAIVILFEMTFDYSIILPLMFVCVIADQTSWALSKESIYSLKLRRKGLSFASDIGVNVMAVTLIRDIMTTDIQSARDDMTLAEAENKLLPSGHSIYPVVNERGIISGVVRNNHIRRKKNKLGPDAHISDIKLKSHAIVAPDDTVLSAVKKIEKTRDPRIIVVDPKTQKLLGIVSPVDFVRLSSSDVE